MVTTSKGTEVMLASFLEQLKDILAGKQPCGEGKKPIANLLFQFIKDVTGYLDVAVMHIDRFRSGSGSPHSARMPSSSSSPEVVSILGEVDGVLYYCRGEELCKLHRENSGLHLAYPRAKIILKDDVPEELALALVDEMLKKLEFFTLSDSGQVPQPCNGFVIKYVTRGADGSMGTWEFAFIEKSGDVQNYREATTAFSLRQKGDAAQKKLQQMESIFIYAGQWISIEKNLSREITPIDHRIGGITPTDLIVSERGVTV